MKPIWTTEENTKEYTTFALYFTFSNKIFILQKVHTKVKLPSYTR